MRLAVILGVASMVAAHAQPAGSQWFSAWTAAPAYILNTSMSGNSVRMIVRPTISGPAVRVRLENTFVQAPVVFSSVYIGQVQSGAALVPGSNSQLTFNGKPGLTLAAGAGAYSDPLTFPVVAFTRYAISIDVTTAAAISGHALGLVTNYMATGSHAADAAAVSFTAVPDGNTNPNQGASFPSYWVTAVDVASASNTGTVVTLGDSITDGYCSTRANNGAFDGAEIPDLYNRWPDLLAMRFAASPQNQSKAVANEGISGNTVIAPQLAGPPAVSRLDDDVIARAGATHVILLEGTNDIGSEGATATAVIAGDQQIIDRVHAAGLKIIGATLLPRGGEGAWTAFEEQQRLALNDWIRHQANFDGVIDFDKLMQGSVNAKNNNFPEIPPQWGCWDGVHPNSAGYAAMAASIDLSLFNSTPAITLVANAEGESPTIAPNTWVEIKGSNLAPVGDTRIWGGSDFVGGKMPSALDGVSVTVNGKSAFVYYISPTQVNILTPPDAIAGSVQVIVTNNGSPSAPYTAQAQALSPSFFVFNGGPYVAATHADGSLLGPASLYPGSTAPAKPGETVVLYANGFGPTSTMVVSGSTTQSGNLAPPPVITIGGTAATVLFAGLVAPGEFQFNVVVPPGAFGGDNMLVAAYNGSSTATVSLTIQGPAPPPTSATFFVGLNGNDSWSGTLPAPNPANTDGPFASFDRARAAVAALSKAGLKQVAVQFRGGTYYLSATEQFTAADSGSAALQVIYENFPGETPVISGGMRIQNWTYAGGNTWKATLPASTQYFENLFYNGERRLRPRLGGYLGTYYRVADTVYLSAPAPPAAAPEPSCSIYVTGKGWECFDRFLYNPTDPVTNTWKNLAPPPGNLCGQPAGAPALAGDVELVIFEKFYVGRQRISCVDTAKHLVYLTGPTNINSGDYTALGYIPQHRYLVENVQDQLTQPGQWFLDRSATSWTLTYLANSGENPNTDTVVIPQLTQVLVASNLQYVNFQGLTFGYDNFTVPAAGIDSDADQITAAVSFQNSQHITFDSGIVAHTSGTGLEFISCINAQSHPSCVSRDPNAVTANNMIQNSAFYDVGVAGIRIGTYGITGDTNANVPQFITVQNNVVAGFGRLFPAAKGLLQGDGHDNLYTHNDVYDGYHGAISICFCSGIPGLAPLTNNITVSFNHVYNLLQGIMNDGGSIYFRTSTTATNPPSSGTGNKMLNNKVHDVSDSSIMDADGYGGDGLYIDDIAGLADMENNLVYRVSGAAVDFSGSRAGPNQSSTIKNNIFAFARSSLIQAANPYAQTSQFPAPMFFTASDNLFYFDRSSASSPSFYAQGGCVYDGGVAYTSFEQWSSNLYWRTDGAFASDPKAFHILPNPVSQSNICFGAPAEAAWTNYTFSAWQKLGEDPQSVVQDPGFKNPAYPADDFSLPKGSPGAGFVVFDATQAGRTNPVITPPPVPATFPTKSFNPATDY